MHAKTEAQVCAFFALSAVIGLQAALGADPIIHADWDEPGDPPQLLVDYLVSTSSPASPEFPDVELVTGSLTWQIWSTDSDNPDNIGDIGVISSPHAQNFGVEIEGPGEIAGAREVKGINLDPQGEGSDANYSNLNGGSISGNLTGNLFLQCSDTQQGGVASFTIGGDAEGDIDVPLVSSVAISGDAIGTITVSALYPSLTIGGDLLGRIEITEFIPLAELTVHGNVKPDASIEIGNVLGPASLTFGQEGVPSEFSGDLALLTGIPEGVIVTIYGPLTPVGQHTPTIDLNEKDVAGELQIPRAGNGDIINGGAVTNEVRLGGGRALLAPG